MDTEGTGEGIGTAEDERRGQSERRQDLSPTTWGTAEVRSRVDATAWRRDLAPGSIRTSLPHFRRSVAEPDYIAFTALLNKAGEEHMLHKWWEEVPYDLEVTETQSPKDHLSKRQKRIQRQQYWEKPCESKETAPGDIGKEVCERIPWWTPKEPEKESEQWRTSEEGNPKEARTCCRQPGELPKSGVEWMQQRGEEIWPQGAYERACHASGEAWPNQVRELGTGEEGAGEERRHGNCT
ncbi:hypothetical protein NDU88_003157 [Pleurodeles waltl]|uniref:Uncharacterized protein n=1 Tax=Pleurodeles waltl TaxID=8319 RepID=A0AAV7TN95_PLEWA|nr:hypothetical protein NDU88_003157 [Pleurodeles waltl]